MATALINLGGLIGGIFGQHHAAAVKNEAQAMNTIIPEVNQSFQNIVNGVNAGQFSIQDANLYLDQVLAGYDDVVYNQFKVKRKSGNGPDLVGKQFQNDVAGIKNLLNSGKTGSFLVSDIPEGMQSRFQKAGYRNYPAFQVTYNPSSIGNFLDLLGLDSITGQVNSGNLSTSAASGLNIPPVYLLAAGGLIFVFLLARK